MLSITNLKGFLQQAQMPASSIYSLLTQRSALVEAALPPSPAHPLSALSFWAFFFILNNNIISRRDCSIVHHWIGILWIPETWGETREISTSPSFDRCCSLHKVEFMFQLLLTSSMKQHSSPPLKFLSWEPLLGPAPISKHKKLQRLLHQGVNFIRYLQQNLKHGLNPVVTSHSAKTRGSSPFLFNIEQ